MTGRRGWAGIPYREKSAAEWDGLNRQEAENRQMKKLGCQPMLVEQKRHVLGGPDLDFKVWVSCTCLKWMSSRWFDSVDAALEAYGQHTGAAA